MKMVINDEEYQVLEFFGRRGSLRLTNFHKRVSASESLKTSALG